MNGFIKVAGDYSDWNVYKKSVIICDVTEMFILRAVTYSKRTEEQMRQSARSCKQNIVEGISDRTTSVETCLKLIGIARGSARELREDYGDFLRQHDLEIWKPDDERTIAARKYCRYHEDPTEFVKKCRERSNETVANIMLTQLRQIDSMLAHVLKKIETDFLNEGGLREQMAKARKISRGY